jgi:succinate dehydrogenase hydrophobic membrane anchor protein
MASETVVERFKPKDSADGSLNWFLQRISGVMILPLLGIHLIIIHFLTENQASADETIKRFKDLWYLIFDFLLISSLTYHALNGVGTILYDFNPSKEKERIIRNGLMILGIVTVIWGVTILLIIQGKVD